MWCTCAYSTCQKYVATSLTKNSPTSAELPRNLRKGRLSMKRYDYPITSLCVVDRRIDVDPFGEQTTVCAISSG